MSSMIMTNKFQIRIILSQTQSNLRRRKRLKWSKYWIQCRESTRRRINAFIVKNSNIERMNARNILSKKKQKMKMKTQRMTQWNKETQRYTSLAWSMSPTWLSHKSYLNQTMKIYDIWIVRWINIYYHIRIYSSIIILSLTIQRM